MIGGFDAETETERRAASRSTTAADAMQRIVAARLAIPLTDEQVATLQRCLPPVEQPRASAA